MHACTSIVCSCVAAKSGGGQGADRCTEGGEQACQEAHRQERLHGVLAVRLNLLADCDGPRWKNA